jgi:hypothetical protein
MYLYINIHNKCSLMYPYNPSVIKFLSLINIMSEVENNIIE